MNYPIAVVFSLVCIAFIAHMTGGIAESLTVRPSKNGNGKIDDNTGNNASLSAPEKVERNWVQLMCAFQLVSIDLVVIAGILYFLAFTDLLQPAPKIAMALAVLFACWGASWLIQLASLKRPGRDYLRLGHWMFWFLCSGLLFWGAAAFP